jgi:hypothetical protein
MKIAKKEEGFFEGLNFKASIKWTTESGRVFLQTEANSFGTSVYEVTDTGVVYVSGGLGMGEPDVLWTELNAAVVQYSLNQPNSPERNNVVMT